MTILEKFTISIIKKTELGSALALRLTKLTGKSKEPLHPKHFLNESPWFIKYLQKTNTVLDLGSGNGLYSIKSAPFVKSITGIEFDPKNLKISKNLVQQKKIKNINFIFGDLEKPLDFSSNSFDCIIFLDVLEHLTDRDQILKEVKRVMKKNGLLFLLVPNSQTSWKKKLRKAGLNSFSDPDHKVEFSEDEIRGLLKKHGFKILNLEYDTYDIAFRGLLDILGALSLNLYKKIHKWRLNLSQKNPQEAGGFKIVAKLQ